MTTDLVVATPQTSLLSARRLLACHDIRHLPVVDGERLVGIVSDRDLRVGDRVLAAALAPLQSDLVGGRYRPIEAVMSKPVHTVSPSETLAAAAKLMLDSGISALPVVDEGRLVGILTTSDCLCATLPMDVQRERGSGSPLRATS
jgi:acetoin utilization protein AcuB